MLGVVSGPSPAWSWIYIIVAVGAGIAAIFGGGGLLALVRAIGDSALRNRRNDETADIVLGNKDRQIPPFTDVINKRLDGQDSLLSKQGSQLMELGTHLQSLTHRVDQVLKKVTPNGGDSNEIGDVVTRMERSLGDLLRQLKDQAAGPPGQPKG